MPRDLHSRLHLCQYCDRVAVRTWDDDLRTCEHEMCMSLAFREIVLRNHRGRRTSIHIEDLVAPQVIGRDSDAHRRRRAA